MGASPLFRNLFLRQKETFMTQTFSRMGLCVLAFAFCVHAQTKIAAVGNSITYGYGLNSPYYESYPSQLQNLLGSAYTVNNFGVSSQTMLKKGDQPYWNQSAYTNAKAFLPNIVIIELGTNDSKLTVNWNPHGSEFIADYTSMIDAFRTLSSNPQIWICMQPPAYQDIWDIYDTTIHNQVNPKIRQVALTQGVHLIDLYSTLSNHSDWFLSADGIHPNVTGALELAKIVQTQLAQYPFIITQSGQQLSAPAGISYQWYRDGAMLSGDTLQTLKASSAGSYKVSVQFESSHQSRIVSEALAVSGVVSVQAPSTTKTKLRVHKYNLLGQTIP